MLNKYNIKQLDTRVHRMQIVRIFSLLTLIVVYTYAIEITSHEEKFTLLCVEESSVGFDWNNNQWNPTDFKVSTLVIKKVDKAADMYFCSKSSTKDIGGYITVEQCYSTKMHSNSYVSKQMCSESWDKEDKSKNMSMLDCQSLTGSMKILVSNGSFIRTNTHTNMTNSGKHSSIFISHGHCSKI